MANVQLYVNSAIVGDWTGTGTTPYLDAQDDTNYISNNGRNKNTPATRERNRNGSVGDSRSSRRSAASAISGLTG